MSYPALQTVSRAEQRTDTFRGYNHTLNARDGEFYDCLNLTTKYYPIFSSCKATSTFRSFGGTLQGVIYKERLWYVLSNTLYGEGVGATALSGLSDGDKQMVSMGAYICIFPDGAYYNTMVENDYGFMECRFDYSTSEDYKDWKIETCDENGTVYNVQSEGSNAPANPTDGQYWANTYPQRELKKWNASLSSWETVTSVYNKITFLDDDEFELAAKYKDGDKIFIYSGGFVINEERTINKVDREYSIGSEYPQRTFLIIKGVAMTAKEYSQAELWLIRNVPVMDYVCECNNRLWGCRYGSKRVNGVISENSHVNELYCCALGDFRNWYKYEGISTDSWTASLGSDGPFTGAVSFNGSPLFFKDRRVHQVTISPTGAHRVNDVELYGVAEGSYKSLCSSNDILYYLSDNGVTAYQGGITEKISTALGEDRLMSGVFCSDGNFLYCSVYNHTQNENMLFVYDIKRKLWSRKDCPAIKFIFNADENVQAITWDSMIEISENSMSRPYVDNWFCETGYIGYEITGHKYISRFNVRCQIEAGASIEMYIEYDSSGVWCFAGRITADLTRSYKFPVKPRRCDHMRLRLQGTGGVKIFSISREVAKGSDNR